MQVLCVKEGIRRKELVRFRFTSSLQQMVPDVKDTILIVPRRDLTLTDGVLDT